MNITNLESNAKKVKYTYIDNDSNTICFMLSGAGYTYAKPLLYYSTMKMIENKIDIVQIHYSYDVDNLKKDVKNFIHLMIEDVESVVEEVLAAKQYEKILFIGKSLGTLPISYKYGINGDYSNAKLILLTPLLKLDGFLENVSASKNDLLVVIGTKDDHFIEEKIAQLRKKETLALLEVEGANHSLEIEPIHTTESLKVISKLMEEIHQFTSRD